MTSLHVERIDRTAAPELPRISEALEAAARHIGIDIPENATVNLVVVDDVEIAELSGQFRGYAHATDVLSFVIGDRNLETGHYEFGEIVVSVDTARREAERRDLPVETELMLYAVHGMLHLLGREDETDDGRAQMNAEQTAVLQSLGYALPDSSTTGEP